jgi:hypothetical protein
MSDLDKFVESVGQEDRAKNVARGLRLNANEYARAALEAVGPAPEYDAVGTTRQTPSVVINGHEVMLKEVRNTVSDEVIATDLELCVFTGKEFLTYAYLFEDTRYIEFEENRTVRDWNEYNWEQDQEVVDILETIRDHAILTTVIDSVLSPLNQN